MKLKIESLHVSPRSARPNLKMEQIARDDDEIIRGNLMAAGNELKQGVFTIRMNESYRSKVYITYSVDYF